MRDSVFSLRHAHRREFVMLVRRIAIAGAILVTTTSAFCATRVWSGAPGTPSLWSNAANWNGVAPVAGDDLVFPAGVPGASTNDFPAGTQFNSISIGQPFDDLRGNAVRLGSGGINSTALNFVSVGFPITLAASQTWSAKSQLAVVGDINLNGQILTFDGSGTFVMNGNVIGTGNINIMEDGGVLSFGNNTFNGTYTNAGGGLNLLGNLSAPYVQTAGNLAFSSNATMAAIDIRAGTVAPGTGSGGSKIANAGNVTLKSGVRYVEAIQTSDTATGFGNLHVAGTVDLGNARLDIFDGGATVSAGTRLTIIDNDGSDPVVGTFVGLPEGAIVVAQHYYRISYAGGTGNDVVLTATETIPTLSWWGLFALFAALAATAIIRIRPAM